MGGVAVTETWARREGLVIYLSLRESPLPGEPHSQVRFRAPHARARAALALVVAEIARRAGDPALGLHPATGLPRRFFERERCEVCGDTHAESGRGGTCLLCVPALHSLMCAAARARAGVAA